MTKAQISELQKRLLALARELSRREARRIEPNRKDEAEVIDEDDLALNEMLQSIASNRNRNDAVLVSRVDRAIAKLRETPDEYGVCEECGDEIAFGRLKAMPYAELCVDCQARHDGPRGGQTRRKVTDYVD